MTKSNRKVGIKSVRVTLNPNPTIRVGIKGGGDYQFGERRPTAYADMRSDLELAHTLIAAGIWILQTSAVRGAMSEQSD